jgi:hypothetical protein
LQQAAAAAKDLFALRLFERRNEFGRRRRRRRRRRKSGIG